jgi:hypothetical protein
MGCTLQEVLRAAGCGSYGLVAVMEKRPSRVSVSWKNGNNIGNLEGT